MIDNKSSSSNIIITSFSIYFSTKKQEISQKMKTKMLITLFALVSVAGTSEATGTLAAQQNTSIIPTYTLWCMENPYAYFRRVISSLKWACKNGADCSPLEKGGRCQDLDNYRSQASYAFNDYYQKNPIPRNCDFNGAAVLTVQDPSNTKHFTFEKIKPTSDQNS